MRQVYGRGRQALQAVNTSPSDTALHEWRKQVKYLRYQVRLLRPIWPGSPLQGNSGCRALTEYFRRLFQGSPRGSDERAVKMFQHAVLDGKAAVAVQPRGDVETKRALELLNEAGPVEMRGADLESQTLEGAAAEGETPIVTWFGKVLAAPGAPDTTGLAKLP